MRYYLYIDNIHGGTSGDHRFEGAFDDVSFLSYQIDRLVELSRSGGGSQTTPADFSPLTLQLPIDQGLTDIYSAAQGGDPIASIRLIGVTDDIAATVAFELKLGEVRIEQLVQTNASDSLVLGYEAISVSTWETDARGQRGEEQNFSWNLNQQSDAVNIRDPRLPRDASVGEEPEHYFLFIDGVRGSSTREHFEGAFEIDNFFIGVDGAAAAVGGGRASLGEPTPLSVQIEFSDGLTDLMEAMAHGRQFASVRLVGTTGGQNPVVTYDLRLGDAFLTGLQDANGHGGLEFAYESLRLEISDAESVATPEVFAWHVPGGGIPDPQIPHDGSGGGAEHYYLFIDGIRGSSTHARYAGAFEIDSHQLSLASSVNTSTGGSLSVSRAQFSDLSVFLDLDDGLTGLLAASAAGRTIPSLRLVGTNEVRGDEIETFDLLLGDVLVTRVGESAALDHVQFTYEAIRLVTTPIDERGTAGSTDEFRWNLESNSNQVTIDPPRLPLTASGGDAAHYYLFIDGLNGGSTAQHFEGAFEIFDHQLSVDLPVLLGAGGQMPGRADFGPLDVTLALEGGLTGALGELVGGTHLPAIRLVGVTDGESPQITYDLRLGDAQITDIQNFGAGSRMSFEYGQINLTTRDQLPNGSLGNANTFAWDVAENRSGGTIPLPHLGNAVPGGGASHYYLVIDHLNGGSVAEDFVGAFEIDAYNISFHSEPDIAGGGGTTSSRPEFSPLTVNLSLTDGLTSLLDDLATGTTRTVRLVGLSEGEDPLVTYDLRLDGARLTSYDDNTWGDSLSFDYDRISVRTREAEPGGNVLQSPVFGWNLEDNRASGEVPVARPASQSLGGVGERHYLFLDGIEGNSVADGFAGAFDVTDFHLGAFRVDSENGRETGRPQFSDLQIFLLDGHDNIDILAAIASGETLRTARLVSVSGGESPLVTFDLRLAEVDVSQIVESAGRGFEQEFLSLHFGAIQILTTDQTARGEAGAGGEFAWDLRSNSPGDDIPLPNSNSAPIITSNGGGATAAASVAEGTTLVTTLVASDPEATAGTQTLGYAIVGGEDADLFEIRSGNQLHFRNAPDFESLPVAGALAGYQVIVQVSDGEGGSDSQAFTVDVSDENEAPLVSGLVDFGLLNGGSRLITTAELLANASDPDAGDTLQVENLTLNAEAGSLAAQGPGTWIYTAAAGFVGTASFSYQVGDGEFHTAGSARLDVSNPIVALSGQRQVSGSAAAETFVVERSNLEINSGAGDDVIIIDPESHGDLRHVINGGSGNDTLDFSRFTEPVMVSLQGGNLVSLEYGAASVRGIENLIGGSGNDALFGNAGANRLAGGAGNDQIIGRDGNDTLIGDAGNDVLIGGNGNDRFVFAPGFGDDLIIDFRVGNAVSHDTLDLRGLGFASRADVLADATGAGASVVLHAGDDSVTLQGVSLAQLSAAEHWLLV